MKFIRIDNTIINLDDVRKLTHRLEGGKDMLYVTFKSGIVECYDETLIYIEQVLRRECFLLEI